MAKLPQDVTGQRRISVGLVFENHFEQVRGAADVDPAIDKPRPVGSLLSNNKVFILVGKLTRNRFQDVSVGVAMPSSEPNSSTITAIWTLERRNCSIRRNAGTLSCTTSGCRRERSRLTFPS